MLNRTYGERPSPEFGYVGPLDVCAGGSIVEARFTEPVEGYVMAINVEDYLDDDGRIGLLGPEGPGSSLFGADGIDAMVYLDEEFDEGLRAEPDTIVADIEVICVAEPMVGQEFDDVVDNDILDDIFDDELFEI